MTKEKEEGGKKMDCELLKINKNERNVKLAFHFYFETTLSSHNKRG